MDAGSIFRWWNAIYSLPLAFVLFFLAITAIVSLAGDLFGGLSHHGDSAAHGSADADHDLDVDADVDADADVDVEHDLDASHDGHAHGHDGHGHGPSGLAATLGFLGVGQAGLMMVLQMLLLFWGLIGISLHRAIGATGPGVLLWSLPVTLVTSVFATRTLARLFGRFFKSFETSALQRHELVGRTGRVVFPVTEEEGTIHVHDAHGTLHRLAAHAEHGRLESGQEIVILGYDPDRKRYRVDDATQFLDR